MSRPQRFIQNYIDFSIYLMILHKTSFGATPEGGPRFKMVLLKLIHFLSREAGFPFTRPLPLARPRRGRAIISCGPEGVALPA